MLLIPFAYFLDFRVEIQIKSYDSITQTGGGKFGIRVKIYLFILPQHRSSTQTTLSTSHDHPFQIPSTTINIELKMI